MRSTDEGWGEVEDPGPLFGPTVVRWYPVIQWFDGAGFADLLRSTSLYRRIDQATREPLLDAIAERIRSQMGTERHAVTSGCSGSDSVPADCRAESSTPAIRGGRQPRLRRQVVAPRGDADRSTVGRLIEGHLDRGHRGETPPIPGVRSSQVIPPIVLAGLLAGMGLGSPGGRKLAIVGSVVVSALWGLGIGAANDLLTGLAAAGLAAANVAVGAAVGAVIGWVVRRADAYSN